MMMRSDQDIKVNNGDIYITGVEEEIRLIKSVFYDVCTDIFREFFTEHGSVLFELDDDTHFNQFCEFVADKMMLYYIHNGLTSEDSAISGQYKIKEMANSISDSVVEAFFCDFFVYGILFHGKTHEKFKMCYIKGLNDEK